MKQRTEPQRSPFVPPISIRSDEFYEDQIHALETEPPIAPTLSRFVQLFFLMLTSPTSLIKTAYEEKDWTVLVLLVAFYLSLGALLTTVVIPGIIMAMPSTLASFLAFPSAWLLGELGIESSAITSASLTFIGVLGALWGAWASCSCVFIESNQETDTPPTPPQAIGHDEEELRDVLDHDPDFIDSPNQDYLSDSKDSMEPLWVPSDALQEDEQSPSAFRF